MRQSGEYGIVAYGGYIPKLRMARATIAAAHSWMAPGLKGQTRGHRAFCGWDEDVLTMAVEAARDALGGRARGDIAALSLASTTMPFADLQPSSIVARALGLTDAVRTLDLGFSRRAGTSALNAALLTDSGPGLVIASERPRGKPASTQEINYGAGAAAFVLGTDAPLAVLLGSTSRTAMFVDQFRAQGARYDYHWEERWIRDEGYLKLVVDSVAATLADARVTAGEIDHFILPALNSGVALSVARELRIEAEAVAPALAESCGYCGGAHSLLMLAHSLEKAKANELIVLIGFGQGVDVTVLRTTAAISDFRPRRGVARAATEMVIRDQYLQLASNEGALDLEWGMRAERAIKTALAEQYRSNNQLASFVAGKCARCGTIQFPQMPFCVNPICNAPRDEFEPYPLADEPAKVLTYTADWLAHCEAPPLYAGFVQFAHGARVMMEIVDVGAEGIDVGTPLSIVFRIKDVDRARGYPRYFWKATPLKA